jgi:hypothetical protein
MTKELRCRTGAKCKRGIMKIFIQPAAINSLLCMGGIGCKQVSRDGKQAAYCPITLVH